MTSRWFEIALPVPTDLVDEAAALLDFAGFGGVEIRERGNSTHVVVVVEADDDARQSVATAREALEVLGAGQPVATELDPKVWTENWKSHFARRTFAGRVEVRPPWEETPTDGLLSIVINPGMAFGTGLHETTAGCLELLVDEVRPGMRVADVGCGSGILAIAAVGLGAAEALATDVDPLAVDATNENIVANGVAGAVSVELEPGVVGMPEWETDARPGLTEARAASEAAANRNTASARESGGTSAGGQSSASPSREAAAKTSPTGGASPNRDADRTSNIVADSPPPKPNGATAGGFTSRGAAAFDLVVANILAESLCEMHDSLTAAVRPGGVLVLSGIEAKRLKMVEEAFIRPPWRLARTITKGDWVSLSLHHGALAETMQSASAEPASAERRTIRSSLNR